MPPVSKKFKITEAVAMDLVPTECFKQGAEGRIFKTEYLGRSVLVKERFSKKYRHPKLDELLTKERITSEIRGLMKTRIAGIRTPTVYAVNSLKNQIIMEIIEGKTIKDILLILEESTKQNNIVLGDESEMIVEEDDSDDEENEANGDANVKNGKTKDLDSKSSQLAPPVIPNTEDASLDETTKTNTQSLLLNLSSDHIDLSSDNIDNIIKLLSLEIGSVLSTMHVNNIIHGDLTTSNMIFTPDHNLVPIDFGLSQIKTTSEDKAVDLYVLKRAILSLHSIFSRKMWDWIVASYREGNKKQFETVWKTFQEVELRGRKRCMVG